jgi:hypothetical protein
VHVFLATELARASTHDHEVEGITGLVLVPMMDALRMFHSRLSISRREHLHLEYDSRIAVLTTTT